MGGRNTGSEWEGGTQALSGREGNMHIHTYAHIQRGRLMYRDTQTHTGTKRQMHLLHKLCMTITHQTDACRYV